MKIADWGEMQGALLLFGGPCSNFEATEALLRIGQGFGAAQMICTGDVVAYCGDPAPTVAAIRAGGVRVIAGNCEVQLASGASDCGCGFDAGSACDLLSAQWFAFAQSRLDDGARSWMGALPDWAVFTHAGRRYAVVHGAASNLSKFLWPTSQEAEFASEIAIIEAACGPVDRIVSGHSGIGFVRPVMGRHLWINAGVIGMPPHDGHAQTQYAALDKDGGVRLHRLAYEAAGAAARMRAQNLPEGYAAALTSGWWPSEDVLPEAMRRAAAKAGAGAAGEARPNPWPEGDAPAPAL